VPLNAQKLTSITPDGSFFQVVDQGQASARRRSRRGPSLRRYARGSPRTERP